MVRTFAERYFSKLIFGIWLLLSAALIISSWANIRAGVGWDPDDQLRLVQLRDFLNGQSWFDNNQYRLNPPDGAPMHWSRLVELPLAAVVICLKPLFGQAVAEIVAATIVPLLLYGGIILLLAWTALHVGRQKAGIAAAIIAAMSVPLVSQLRPMRIDHHGWQIFMAVTALASLFHANARNAGIVLGMVLAVWLHISLEGAPMSAAFFLFLGWQWLVRSQDTRRLFWTIAAFAMASLALFLGTQAQGLGAPIYCDTVSPPHIWAILSATAIMLPCLIGAPQRQLLRALAMLSAAGAAILVIALRAPECMEGAFGTLDPLVHDYWFVYVKEGMPIWYQSGSTAAALLAGPIVGLFSSLYLARIATGHDRDKMITLSFFCCYALTLSLLVFRTVSVASAYAVAPAAALIAHLFVQYQKEGAAPRRILGVAAMLFLVVPGALVNSFIHLWPTERALHVTQRTKDPDICESAQSVDALVVLPAGQFIAPFDMAPMILARTGHSVLASSHHRNERAMHDHIMVFRSPPAISHQLLIKRGIDYVAVCSDEEELANYVARDPRGLWAQIARGEVPDWLEPLPVMGKGIQVWRVR